MLLGSIVHSLFQQAIKLKKKPNLDELKQLARDIVFDPCYLKDM